MLLFEASDEVDWASACPDCIGKATSPSRDGLRSIEGECGCVGAPGDSMGENGAPVPATEVSSRAGNGAEPMSGVLNASAEPLSAGIDGTRRAATGWSAVGTDGSGWLCENVSEVGDLLDEDRNVPNHRRLLSLLPLAVLDVGEGGSGAANGAVGGMSNGAGGRSCSVDTLAGTNG